MEIIKKESRVIIKGITQGNIVIPSKMYPLESTGYEMFDFQNTIPVTDERLISIFDSIKAENGRCYTNSEKLMMSLVSTGYDAKQYVGWKFLGDVLPVHHSFVIVNRYLLDLSYELEDENLEKQCSNANMTEDEMRKIIVSHLKDREQLDNHLKYTCGQCPKGAFYLAAPGTKEQGINRNRQLRKDYPHHPAFADVQRNGLTLTQQMMLSDNLSV